MTDQTMVLRVENISKRLGGRQILKDVSLELHRGELKVLIGHTPLQVICGAVLGIIVGIISINILP